MRRFFLRNNKGDTIVEVMIAVAVISSVLGITYSIMNRNLLVMRENQERSEALRIAQGQIESLRNLWDINRGTVTHLAWNTFCMVDSAPVMQDEIDEPSYVADPNNDPRDDYEPECEQGLYRIAIVEGQPVGLTNNVFIVHVRWDNLLGGVSQVRLVYGLDWTW